MGIKGLSKFLQENIPACIKQVSLSELFGKTIAIDTNYYMYKYTISTDDFVSKFGSQYDHLRRYGIKPVYVFDGKPPCEKQLMLDKRKRVNQKKNVGVTTDDLKKLKSYFKMNNIVYLECTAEADFICGKLSKEYLIDGCITDDMDFLALGCKRMYREYYQTSSEIMEYNLDEILKTYNTRKFIDICIFLGCDYCDRIYDMVNRSFAINVFELFTKYDTLENVWTYLYMNNMLMFVDDDKSLETKKKWDKARIILENETNFDYTSFLPYVKTVFNNLEKLYDTIPCLIDFNFIEKDTEYTQIKGAFIKMKAKPNKKLTNVDSPNIFNVLEVF
jgi:5'-3' exonuclease